jgi:hypothetical protein
MKRRSFLKTSLTAAGAGAFAAMSKTSAADADGAPPAGSPRQFYELRLYHLRRGPQQKIFDAYFQNAAIPALRRAGFGPIGVFSVMAGPDSPTMYVLMPFTSVEAALLSEDKLRDDAEYQKLGAVFLEAPATEPAFMRMESWLLGAIAGAPKLEIPAGTAENKSRIFELRTYESHSKQANQKKISMFNHGELAIFKKAGLTQVFFGEALVGSRLPNLTYMLVFDDLAAHDKNWHAFSSDPDWKKLSTTPGYTDGEIVCNISNVFLRPASYSQI